MMENRSVDHYLGWYGAENPAFDAHQSAQFPDLRVGANGRMVSTANWGAAGRGNWHGRGFADPSHGWTGGRLERNGGACDGWLHPGTGNDEFALSYYDAGDIPVWAQLVRNYQSYDRWFASLLGPTQPNRYYLHSGQSGGLKNNDTPPQQAQQHPEWSHGWDWPTIWTLLDNAGVSCAYYFSNLPQIGLWGERHIAKARHISEYYASAAAGQLPQVSFIDPWYTGPNGIANDDHPHADIRLGQSFLSDVTEAFVTSSYYRSGALVVTYDEWGGFWDHVAPPRVADDRGTDADPGGAEDFAQLGFRIPSSIVSPWTRGPAGNQTTYEHTSIIKFISDNWGLPYLTRRHASTNSIESAFREFASYDPTPVFTPYEAPLDVTLEPALEGDPGKLLPFGVNNIPGLPPLPATPVATSASSPPVAVSEIYELAETGWFDKHRFRTDWRFEDSFLKSRPELLSSIKR
jgi:phospholipase C